MWLEAGWRGQQEASRSHRAGVPEDEDTGRQAQVTALTDPGEHAVLMVVNVVSQACRLNHAPEFDSLLHCGVPVDSRDNHGNTSLIISAQHGHLQLAHK